MHLLTAVLSSKEAMDLVFYMTCISNSHRRQRLLWRTERSLNRGKSICEMQLRPLSYVRITLYDSSFQLPCIACSAIYVRECKITLLRILVPQKHEYWLLLEPLTERNLWVFNTSPLFRTVWEITTRWKTTVTWTRKETRRCLKHWWGVSEIWLCLLFVPLLRVRFIP